MNTRYDSRRSDYDCLKILNRGQMTPGYQKLLKSLGHLSIGPHDKEKYNSYLSLYPCIDMSLQMHGWELTCAWLQLYRYMGTTIQVYGYYYTDT